MKKIFIDGSAGTTGLRIRERLSARRDLELLELSGEMRKDADARRDKIAEADVAFLCLPDDAARESAAMAGDDTVVIDTSTAHRVADGWTYGFAELTGKREEIRTSRRIANPGCHASGFIALIAPLVERGIVARGARLNCTSLTGYSGGGKKMIAEYEDASNSDRLRAPRMYGLAQSHKHLPEMAKICGLDAPPTFVPIVSSFYAGMAVSVQLFADETGGIDRVRDALREQYDGRIVRCVDSPDEGGFMSAAAMAGRDDMEISVFGGADRILLVSRFDNLGKGASGAAIQNMNIALGFDEAEGLSI